MMRRDPLIRSARSGLVVAATATALALGLSGCVDPGPASPSTGTATSTPSATSSPTSSPRPTAPSTSPAPGSPTASPSPSSTPQPSTVTVQILNTQYDAGSGQIRVAGMVTDLVSSTGMCVATASQGSTTVDAQVAGQADATVTYCADLAVTLPAGATGTWDLALGFVDADHQGVATTTVLVG
ncbi:hypothetical protein NY547_03230 [Cnuibacter physcomitrellae]|uniref:hypothetical protein n=1 Tax=Cnuibacter physcomitrellae TaxID=1619308 RepID=UPI002175FF9F|nr:hypothetical protein [Cnuibacter physcomitrellae]MCS5496251.1 hypothetical protein [Cnuibacter physcomitrellae]